MVYLVLGGGSRALVHYRRLVEKLKMQAELFRFNPLDFESARFEELIESQPLFGKTLVVASNRLCENPEAARLIIAKLDRLASSPHHFVFLETGLDDELLGRLKKSAQDVKEFEKEVREEKYWVRGGFNIYSLTDVFASRDRRNFWVNLQKAILAGFEPEEIFWKLVWQMKHLLAAKKTRSAKESGLSPYPYQKAKKFSAKFKTGELEKLSVDLVTLYHDCRRGLFDLETGLELLALTL